MGGKFLKQILTNLYSSKYNKINMCYSDIQKLPTKNDLNSISIFNKGSHKRFQKHFSQWGNVFKACFSILLVL